MTAAHTELKAGASVPAPTTEDTLKAILAQLEKRDQVLDRLKGKVDDLEKRRSWIKRLFFR